jgi:hypothetical protein
MNRPLGQYQKVMIESVLKKYGQYTIKHPRLRNIYNRARDRVEKPCRKRRATFCWIKAMLAPFP